MEKQKEHVCPGCSRRCPLSHVRCGYGRKYQEKHEKKQAKKPAEAFAPDKHRHKWEKYATPASPVWKLLWTARTLKRALRKKTVTEAQLLAALSGEEQAQLDACLSKISKVLT